MKNIIWAIRLNVVLGLLVIIMPFLGFPVWLKTSLFVIIGLIIIGASLVVNKKASELHVIEERVNEEKQDIINNH